MCMHINQYTFTGHIYQWKVIVLCNLWMPRACNVDIDVCILAAGVTSLAPAIVPNLVSDTLGIFTTVS